MEPFFSIIIVCLNPGEKLKETLKSVENQTSRNYEVIVKDGLSADGSLSYAYDLQKVWEEEKQRSRRIHIICKKDSGIYDAMNQAAEAAEGKYVYYLNCGDRFASENVLREMADFISGKNRTGIFYGDIYERLTGQRVASNPRIDAFACYRNVPCHQACFYARELLLAHPFETKYKVRADYEQFLWCFFAGEGNGRKDAQSPKKGKECSRTEFFYRDILIADYEGGGFSESKENRKISAREHREITGMYIPSGQLWKFRLIMLLTFSALRTHLAENEKTAGVYNRVKALLYRGKGRCV